MSIGLHIARHTCKVFNNLLSCTCLIDKKLFWYFFKNCILAKKIVMLFGEGQEFQLLSNSFLKSNKFQLKLSCIVSYFFSRSNALLIYFETLKSSSRIHVN